MIVVGMTFALLLMIGNVLAAWELAALFLMPIAFMIPVLLGVTYDLNVYMNNVQFSYEKREKNN